MKIRFYFRAICNNVPAIKYTENSSISTILVSILFSVGLQKIKFYVAQIENLNEDCVPILIVSQLPIRRPPPLRNDHLDIKDAHAQ